MNRIPLVLLVAFLSLSVTRQAIASESTGAEGGGHERSNAKTALSGYAKLHGHDHAKLCAREKCYEYCDVRESDSQGGLLRRLRRECRKDCMEGCEARQGSSAK